MPTKSPSVSIRKLNIFIALITIVISLMLLVTTYRARVSYSNMRDNTSRFILWEKNADTLLRASDYLTEQARCFVETGSREYLDNYFEEANVIRRRDHALEYIQEMMNDSDACRSLEAALQESNTLMEREYYAMRLTVSAFGGNPADYPREIRTVELTEEDALLPPDKQGILARKMMFDDVYHKRKETISGHVQNCLDTLAQEINLRQNASTDALDDMLFKERTLIIIAICFTLLTLLLTMLLVISPLLRAVVYIRADQPIPIVGSKEFQFLAKTYNLMYEANQEKKERLAYEATHDALTGIYNRSGYTFFMKNTDWETSGLLLFDVDKFKQINDRYGHEAGDKALKRVAETILKSFRAQDRVCRIGGDEFAVIMLHTSPDHVQLVRDKVSQINESLSREESNLPPIHVSCGVAYGNTSQNAEEVFRCADTALYNVKRDGGCGCQVSQ